MQIGIVGAGFIARAIAQLALTHGHDAMVSNARGPDTLASIPSGIGARVGTVDEAIGFGDVVLVAIPFHAIGSLPAERLAGKIVIDAGNYYPDRDGRIAELDARRITTSELLARHLPGARIVKAFNAILARDLPLGGRLPGTTEQRALPIAGDDPEAKRIVADLQDAFGFAVVDAGPLAEGWRFERAKPAYCVSLSAMALRAALAAAERNAEVEEGSWRG